MYRRFTHDVPLGTVLCCKKWLVFVNVERLGNQFFCTYQVQKPELISVMHECFLWLKKNKYHYNRICYWRRPISSSYTNSP
uniref:Uncharacterized protein n=1 Tax=Arundo donax TaxID=35708 RepID=A0A0A9A8G5_ARUDO